MDSALLHPESATWEALFKVYSFVSYFFTVPLNRTKLKHGTMKLKTYEKFI